MVVIVLIQYQSKGLLRVLIAMEQANGKNILTALDIKLLRAIHVMERELYGGQND